MTGSQAENTKKASNIWRLLWAASLLFLVLIFLTAILSYTKDVLSYRSLDTSGDISLPQRDYEDYLYLKDRLVQNPSNWENHLFLSEVCINLGFIDEAEDSIDKIINADPPPPPSIKGQAHQIMGYIFITRGELENTVDEIRYIKTIYPYDTPDYELRGLLWFKRGNYRRTINAYMGELVNPTCTDSFLGVGNSYRMLALDEKAEKIYKAGILFDDQCPSIKASLADLYIEQNRFDEAEELLTAALSQDNELGDLYVSMGEMFLARENPDKALEFFAQGLQKDSQSASSAYNGMGEAYLKKAENSQGLSNILIVLWGAFSITLPSILLISFFKKKGIPIKITVKSVALFILLLMVTSTSLLGIFHYNHRFIKAFNSKGMYYIEARNSFRKASLFDPIRQDVRLKTADTLWKTGHFFESAKEKEAAKSLPPFGLQHRLRFLFP